MDPFGDPWGAPSQPAADSSQWAQPPPPAPSASADPWGSSAPTPQPDPFGTSSFPTQDTSPFAAPAKAFAAPIAANTTSDPFGAPPSAQNYPFGSSDPFSSNTTNTPAQPTGENMRIHHCLSSLIGSVVSLLPSYESLFENNFRDMNYNPFVQGNIALGMYPKFIYHSHLHHKL